LHLDIITVGERGHAQHGGRGQKEDILARDNYSYQKRQKELAKKKKKEKKEQRKLDKKNIQVKVDSEQASN